MLRRSLQRELTIGDSEGWGCRMAEMGNGDRLDSWKEIAAYLKRDVTTVQRWEKREAMPVHRHVHDKLGSVYGFRSELDSWTRGRNPAFQPRTIRASPARVHPCRARGGSARSRSAAQRS